MLEYNHPHVNSHTFDPVCRSTAPAYRAINESKESSAFRKTGLKYGL